VSTEPESAIEAPVAAATDDNICNKQQQRQQVLARVGAVESAAALTAIQCPEGFEQLEYVCDRLCISM
jgi:hypothetical protein